MICPHWTGNESTKAQSEWLIQWNSDTYKLAWRRVIQRRPKRVFLFAYVSSLSLTVRGQVALPNHICSDARNECECRSWQVFSAHNLNLKAALDQFYTSHTTSDWSDTELRWTNESGEYRLRSQPVRASATYFYDVWHLKYSHVKK